MITVNSKINEKIKLQRKIKSFVKGFSNKIDVFYFNYINRNDAMQLLILFGKNSQQMKLN